MARKGAAEKRVEKAPRLTAEQESVFDAATEEGIGQADAGLLVPHEDVRRWLKSLGTATPLPRPKPKRKV
jgi:predicted transcriptional regulator